MNLELEMPPPPDPDRIERSVSALPIRQPIGDLYVCSFPAELVCQISNFDVRRMVKANRDVEEYLGIQRPLNGKRVQELEAYVNFRDAAFPTAIIISIDDEYCEYNREEKCLTFRNFKEGETSPDTNFRNLARVIDGQHRIAGLQNFLGAEFEVPVVVFIGADISDQAYIFATVNLKQTKVNKSLAYDLYELESTNSPEKIAHDIAIAFDRDENSPFHKKIKRLGVATPGRNTETITQATFVEALVSYISADPKGDRDKLLRSKRLLPMSSRKLILRDLYLEGRYIDIAKSLDSYFISVSKKWPLSWGNVEPRNIFNRTNGFKALMRLFRNVYAESNPEDGVLTLTMCKKLLDTSTLEDGSFVSTEYEPGSGGESKLYRALRDSMGLTSS